MISLVRKSAPIVALYCDVKRLDTYWFIREVFPTLQNSEEVLERGDETRDRAHKILLQQKDHERNKGLEESPCPAAFQRERRTEGWEEALSICA